MSSNLPYKQAANVERRTWDKETYEAKAKARIAAESSSGDGNSGTNVHNKRQLPSTLNDPGDANDGGDETPNTVLKEEFQAADAGAAGPWRSKRAFLKARRTKVDLESKIGTTEIINPDAAAVSSTNITDGDSVNVTDGVKKGVNGVGWRCEICDCFLKDSMAYLDHINGRKHQRKLGYSMRIAQSTTDEVASKLDLLAKQQKMNKEDDFVNKDEEDNVDAFEEIVKKKDEEIAQRKAERKRRREERKRRARGELVEQAEASTEAESKVENGEEEEAEQEENGGINPDIMAMMGFSGFG